MKNGIYAARVNKNNVVSVFIDQERIELEELNRKVQARLNRGVRKADAKSRRKKQEQILVNKIMKATFLTASITTFGLVGWIHPALAIPAAVATLIHIGSLLRKVKEVKYGKA